MDNIDNKYCNGKIYAIKCLTTGELYIGSTYQSLKTREIKHLTDLHGYLGYDNRIPRNYRTSFEVLFNKNYNYFLIEDYSCCSKEELEIRETLHIYNNTCVNKSKRRITLEDYDLSSLPSVVCPSLT